MTDWQITVALTISGIVSGGIINISLRMDRIERHLSAIARALDRTNPN